MMFQVVTKTIKWVWLPVLLIGSMFSSSVASCQPLLNLMICLGAIIGAERAVRLKKCFWATGFVAIAIVFSPFSLVVKIFLLMGFTCIAALVAIFAAWKMQPVAAA